MKNKRYLQPLFMGLFIIGLIFYLHKTSNPVVTAFHERLEGVFYDIRMRFFLDDVAEHDPRVIIVDIDDKSLKEVGRWPWSRVHLAQLLNKLEVAAPAVIGLDIIFAEPQLSPLDHLLSIAENATEDKLLTGELLQLNSRLDGDAQFENALTGHQSVLGYSLAQDLESSSGTLPEPIIELSDKEASASGVAQMTGYLGNIQRFQNAASGAGFVFVKPDRDGVIRWANMMLQHGNNIYPSLSLSVIQQYLGMPPIELIYAEDSDGGKVLEGISLGGMLTIPTDQYGRVLVPFRGGPLSFTYIPATDILHERFDPAQFTDAIVLVGSTAQGLYDLRATPVSSIYPGVEVHANLLLGMLDELFPQTAEWSEGFDYLVILILGTLLALIMPKLPPFTLLIFTIAAISAYVSFNYWLWYADRIVLSQVMPLMMLFWLGIGNAAYGFIREASDRRNLKNIFGQYVPPQIVEKMNQEPDANYGFEGESREMTVLFADIRSFTKISESMEANELKKMLNYFFTPMTEIIFNSDGAIDKYVGDMIMAFWGAPLDDPKHAHHGIEAALGMLKAVDAMQDELKQRGWPSIQIGVGLNTGKMNVGDMGSHFRRSYTVLGDAVNLGSRLEGLTKFYQVSLCVSEFTRDQAPDYAYRFLDFVRVKGKHEAIRIYEPLMLDRQLSDTARQELLEQETVLQDYYACEWDKAIESFKNMIEKYPDRYIYQLYLERSEQLKAQQVTAPWDGVFEHTSK